MSKERSEDLKLSKKEIEEKVEELRELVLNDNKLKNFRTDDSYLLRFLHCTDFDVAAALQRMKDYCCLLCEHPGWFASTSPLSKKDRLEDKVKAMLQERDKSGRSIYVARLGRLEPNKTSPQEEAQIDELWLEAVMDDPETQAKGVSVIMDMKGYSWKLFKWLTPSNMKVSSAKADLYPCKEVVYHVVNTSLLLNASIKLFWPFLTKKIKERLKFHFEDWPSLHEHIDPSILPPEYGGTGPELDFDKLNQFLYDQDEELERRFKYQRIPQK